MAQIHSVESINKKVGSLAAMELLVLHQDTILEGNDHTCASPCKNDTAKFGGPPKLVPPHVCRDLEHVISSHCSCHCSCGCCRCHRRRWVINCPRISYRAVKFNSSMFQVNISSILLHVWETITSLRLISGCVLPVLMLYGLVKLLAIKLQVRNI